MPGQKRGRRHVRPEPLAEALPAAKTDDAAQKSEAGESAAVALAMRFISLRPRSVKETSQKLADHGFEGNVVADAVSRLVSAGYLDDVRLAVELAGSRIRNKNWGIEKIALDLRSKGVCEDAIHAALSNIDASTDAETARRALEKWTRKTGVNPPLGKKAFEKAFRHLAARGFSAHVIMELLKGVNRRFL